MHYYRQFTKLISLAMSISKIIKKIFAPEPEAAAGIDEPRRKMDGISDSEITVNELLASLHEHFLRTVHKLSSKYNLLYHTSFTIYIKASNYKEISDSLPFLAEGAEKMLVEEIKNQMKKGHAGHKPHSQYWQFQLVEIPADAEIDGVSEEEMQDGVLIQIDSTLFPPMEGEDEAQREGNRIVTTVHGVNSLRAIKNCINPDILNKLYLIETDRIKLNLVLEETSQSTSGFSGSIPVPPPPVNTVHVGGKQNTPAPPAGAPQQKPLYFATLEAQDGEFLDGASNKVIHTVAITADEVEIAGRSSMRGKAGVEVVRVNSDRIMTPHARIRRDPSTGRFAISAIGDTRLNGRTLTPDPERWLPLPNKSTIILADGEVQIRFKSV